MLVTKRQVMRVAVALAVGTVAYVVSAIRLELGPSIFVAVLAAAWTWVLFGLIGRRLARPAPPGQPYAQPPRQRPAPPTETTRSRSGVDSINPFGPRR